MNPNIGFCQKAGFERSYNVKVPIKGTYQPTFFEKSPKNRLFLIETWKQEIESTVSGKMTRENGRMSNLTTVLWHL